MNAQGCQWRTLLQGDQPACDHAGRLNTKATQAAPTTALEGYAYDVQDQLKQVSGSAATPELIEYDPMGQPLCR